MEKYYIENNFFKSGRNGDPESYTLEAIRTKRNYISIAIEIIWNLENINLKNEKNIIIWYRKKISKLGHYWTI